MFETYTLGVDVSHWQPGVDWPLLLENGVDFTWMKTSQGSYGRDPSLVGHYKAARAAGLVCGGYHWFDPNNSPAAQLENLKRSLDEVELAFLAVDVEQYWQDWREWQAGQVQKRIPGEQISERAVALAERLSAWCRKPVLIYTRASFVAEHAPQMAAWLPDWPLWLAHYPYGKGRVTLSWAELKARYRPSIPAPALPAGCTDWTFWQFSGDKFILPGVKTALDLNFFHGSRRSFYDWLEKPLPPAAVNPEEKLRRLWMGSPRIMGGR